MATSSSRTCNSTGVARGSNREQVIAERQKRKLLKKMRKHPNQFVQEHYPVLTRKQFIFTVEILEEIWKVADVFTQKQMALTCKRFYAEKADFFSILSSQVLNLPVPVFQGCSVRHIITTAAPDHIKGFELVRYNGTIETIHINKIGHSAHRIYWDYHIYDISEKFRSSIFVKINIIGLDSNSPGFIDLFRNSERHGGERPNVINRAIENPNGQRRVSVIDDRQRRIKHAAFGKVSVTYKCEGYGYDYDDDDYYGYDDEYGGWYRPGRRYKREYDTTTTHTFIVTTEALIFKF